uniref:Uncharacterized protein n=1 Tax=Oryza sativa subsp. japonica TaxID=39947 RepID=Q67UT2_ORYSJ|nr:hypothetical protein [Oryza sativa Japonica Group]
MTSGARKNEPTARIRQRATENGNLAGAARARFFGARATSRIHELISSFTGARRGSKETHGGDLASAQRWRAAERRMGDGEALKGGLNRGLEEKEAVGVDAEVVRSHDRHPGFGYKRRGPWMTMAMSPKRRCKVWRRAEARRSPRQAE